MKNSIKYLLAISLLFGLMSCSSDDNSPVANNLSLEFTNTFKNETIVLGDASSSDATTNTSEQGQAHHFSELKYVISNIRLVNLEGQEIPYNINDLDNGATVINQAKPETLKYILNNIPAGEYNQIKFGLGVKQELNTLDEVRFPKFYAAAGENDTEMMWEWGTGYRFTKIQGFYDTDNKEMSIHTGSTIDEDETGFIQGVDAYRDIHLSLNTNAVVGAKSPKISIKADFDKLLSGKDKIRLSTGTGSNDNATPNIHTADQMLRFVDNIGGDGSNDKTGMFSILGVEN